MTSAANSQQHPPLPSIDIQFGDSALEYTRRRDQVLRQVKHLHTLQGNMMSSYSHSRVIADLDPSSSLGLSAITVHTLDEEVLGHSQYCYVSESFKDILGYEYGDIVGQTMDSLWHPDELAAATQIRDRAISMEQTACVAYLRLKHKKGGYVNICCSFSVAYDKMVGILTLAENGPMTLQQARTAKAVFEITPSAFGELSQRAWPQSFPKPHHERSISPPLLPLDMSATWELPADRCQRTLFILDRFTDIATVQYVSNEIIVKGASLPSHSFYSIVRPSHRPEARRWIDAAKNWSPVQHNAARSGGHGFTTFDVLKIPDLPPCGDRFPRGTDDGERHMPGQEFIPVEAVFTASSDGVVCVLERLRCRERSPLVRMMGEGVRGKMDPRLLLPQPVPPGSSGSGGSSSFTAVAASAMGGQPMSRGSTLIGSRDHSPSVKSEQKD